MMSQSFLFFSLWVRPSFSDPKLISEKRPWKVLWKDSFSMYLKPSRRVRSKSPSSLRAISAMLFQRNAGWTT